MQRRQNAGDVADAIAERTDVASTQTSAVTSQLVPELLPDIEELRQVCTSQLRLMSASLVKNGAMVASVHIRVPSSLRSGELQLQRVAWTGDVDEAAAEGGAIIIGGEGSSLTEEHIVSQKTLSLPSQGHVVLPLTYKSFLVRACCSRALALRLSCHIAGCGHHLPERTAPLQASVHLWQCRSDCW